MTMTCRACRSEIRDEIDHSLVSAIPLRSIADRSNVSKTSLIRHRDAHLPAVLADSKRAEELTRADVLASTAAGLLDRALGLLERAEAGGDLRGATGALKECRATVELLAKLKPSESFDDTLIPSPRTWARLIEVAAREFQSRPLQAEQLGRELLQAFVGVLKPWVPLLSAGARQRLVNGIREIEIEEEERQR